MLGWVTYRECFQSAWREKVEPLACLWLCQSVALGARKSHLWHACGCTRASAIKAPPVMLGRNHDLWARQDRGPFCTSYSPQGKRVSWGLERR